MLDLLTLEQSHAETIVRELINTFEQGADELNLNCEYDISAGQISDTKDNTWFVFDTQEGTLLDEFKTALFATELSEEEHKIVEVFINISINTFSDSLASASGVKTNKPLYTSTIVSRAGSIISTCSSVES